MTRRACDGRRVIEKDRKKEELTSGQFFLFSLSKKASSRYARAGVLVVSKKK